MTRTLGVAMAALVLGVSAGGQGFSIFFSTDGTEVAFSGAGGSLAAPGNYAAVFRDEGVLMLSPGPGRSAAPCATRASWAAYFGDEDGDANFTEGVAGVVDVVHLASGASNPPGIFDFFVSFSDDAGPLGVLGGLTIRDGDIFRPLPGGGVQFFITEAQIKAAMNTTADLDVNAFMRNPANGDLYWSLTTTQLVNGISVDDGGVVRLPASGYVATPDGRVASVTTGAAQIALHEVHVDIFYFVAGQGTVGDLNGIALAPTGGTFLGPNGVTLPNLWFVADSPTSGPTIVSTVNGGSVPVINGVSMTGGPAFGLGATDFAGGPNSTIASFTWAAFDLATKPRVLSLADAALLTPGTLKIDYGGGVPGPNLYLFANIAVASPAGAFTPRTAVLAGTPLAVPGGFRELYVDDFSDPLFLFLATLPPLTVDALGHASISFPIPATPPGLALSVQGIDASNLALTTPIVVVTQ